ncbi:raffinose synthase, partial [Haematococcus lacustris]
MRDIKHEGLSSLVSGGITPRTLIIDDGWQMTDVDPPSDQAPAVTPSDLAQRLTWLPEEERQLLADTQDEFIRESRE